MVAFLIANAAWWGLRIGATIGNAITAPIWEARGDPEGRRALNAAQRRGGLEGALAGSIQWLQGKGR